MFCNLQAEGDTEVGTARPHSATRALQLPAMQCATWGQVGHHHISPQNCQGRRRVQQVQGYTSSGIDSPSPSPVLSGQDHSQCHHTSAGDPPLGLHPSLSTDWRARAPLEPHLNPAEVFPTAGPGLCYSSAAIRRL